MIPFVSRSISRPESGVEATTQGQTALQAAKVLAVQSDSSTSMLCELRERQPGKTFLFPLPHYPLFILYINLLGK